MKLDLFTDAEKVYNRFKQPCIEVILIHETPIAVEPYYHSLSEEHIDIIERKISKPIVKVQQEDGMIFVNRITLVTSTDSLSMSQVQEKR